MFSSPQGLSAKWWNYRHFQHHVKTNIYPKDPDIDAGPLFVLGDLQPVEVCLEILSTREMFQEVLLGKVYTFVLRRSGWRFCLQACFQSISSFNSMIKILNKWIWFCKKRRKCGMNNSVILKVIQAKSFIEGMAVHSTSAKSWNIYISSYVN